MPHSTMSSCCKRMQSLCLGILLLCLLTTVEADVNGSVSPIIGVLAQELYPDSLTATTYNATSYIAASYVKFIEGAGGRVVPIWIGRNQSYYEKLLLNLQGVLLPGGATWFNETLGYGDAGEHLIRIAKQINDNGTYFPVWGTCLGMELMVLKVANGSETRSDCNSAGQALPLEFQADYNSSRLFAGASDEVIAALANENITYNYHRFCYTVASFDKPALKDNWRIMSLNHDLQGYEFVSTIEHLKYPFYGVQFHPEIPLYEFVGTKMPHTKSAVLVSQYFANFFVNEARQCPHVFAKTTEQKRSLIYNYNPKYTSLVGSSYTQQYVFNFDVDSDFGHDDSPYPLPYPYPAVGGAERHSLGLALVITIAFSMFVVTQTC
ncbi:gamma-glutamyl hydrolase-like [Drosophila sulfurigaster albostrigata]|uniref:gamma-glutamyl hydrolase-like n=1 Tax=Drosophila sulfurigaster albostrigata TaxID=89887 RepID=UPI002D21AECC|nr:gamma-glutamyl hydrolase-like [Drosophila sulfurigaster albostrigata]